MYEPIQDGIGDGAIAERGVPLIDRQLAGHECGAAVVSIIEDLQRIARGLIGERGEAKVIPSLSDRISAAFDAALETGSNRTKWAQVAVQGEAAALEALIGKGYTVLAAQLYVSTDAGLRVTDFVVTGGPAGDDLAGFEVKVNDSPYTALQQLKDPLIAGPNGGTVVNWNQPAFPYGTPVRYTTYLMTVDMEWP